LPAKKEVRFWLGAGFNNICQQVSETLGHGLEDYVMGIAAANSRASRSIHIQDHMEMQTGCVVTRTPYHHMQWSIGVGASGV
jgi:hypothetical protein